MSGPYDMRIYADEAGISAWEPVTVVAGVFIPTRVEHQAVSSAIEVLLNRLVPQQLRDGFVFHASDVFAGNQSREMWRDNSRWQLLEQMVSIPKLFHLPIAYGTSRRGAFKDGPPRKLTAAEFDHVLAFGNFLYAAEAVVARGHGPPGPHQLVVEDNRDMRRRIALEHHFTKDRPVVLSTSAFVTGEGKTSEHERHFQTKTIEAPIFAAKGADPVLQVADACAFTIRRWLSKGKWGTHFMEKMQTRVPDIELYGPGSIVPIYPWIE